MNHPTTADTGSKFNSVHPNETETGWRKHFVYTSLTERKFSLKIVDIYNRPIRHNTTRPYATGINADVTDTDGHVLLATPDLRIRNLQFNAVLKRLR